MSSISHERTDRPQWIEVFKIPEVAGSIAISSMWLAVLFASVFAPDFVSANGSSMTRIPSGAIVAFWAVLGSWLVARHAFGKKS